MAKKPGKAVVRAAEKKDRRLAKQRASQGTALPYSVATSMFFGTLRSELDTSYALVGVFAELQQEFDALRQQFADGALDQVAYGRALATLYCTAPDGTQWTMGATSSNWYSRASAQDAWAPTPPDAALLDEADRLASEQRYRAGFALASAARPAAAPLEVPHALEGRAPVPTDGSSGRGGGDSRDPVGAPPFDALTAVPTTAAPTAMTPTAMAPAPLDA